MAVSFSADGGIDVGVGRARHLGEPPPGRGIGDRQRGAGVEVRGPGDERAGV